MSRNADASANATNTINIDSMSLDQLNQVKSQQENRLEQLTAQYHQLRAVSARLSTAKMAVTDVLSNSSSNNNEDTANAGEGQQIMIPLTESLYAPGTMVDSNKVLVELGAGFFVEKTSRDAIKVLERKAKLVETNSGNVLAAAEATSRNIEAVMGAMQGKMLEIQARQQGMAYKKKVEE